MYIVTYTVGVEYHDEYIPRSHGTLEIPAADDCYNMGQAERKALDQLLGDEDDFESRWARIEKIELKVAE